MYERAPSIAEMNAAGLKPEDFVAEAFEVWPEHWPIFSLFHSLQTQWRASGMGLIGLDYNVLFSKMGRMALTPGEYDDLESDIRTMEIAALGAMNEKSD